MHLQPFECEYKINNKISHSYGRQSVLRAEYLRISKYLRRVHVLQSLFILKYFPNLRTEILAYRNGKLENY